jgi:hypothetical protein
MWERSERTRKVYLQKVNFLEQVEEERGEER